MISVAVVVELVVDDLGIDHIRLVGPLDADSVVTAGTGRGPGAGGPPGLRLLRPLRPDSDPKMSVIDDQLLSSTISASTTSSSEESSAGTSPPGAEASAPSTPPRRGAG